MIFINKKNKTDLLLFIFFSTFPIAMLLGNLLINLFIFIIAILFIFKLLTKKTNLNTQKTIFYILIFFFISLCVNLIFTNDISLSYPRVIKFFFVIFFIIAFSHLIQNHYQNLENIFKVWSIILLIVIFDLAIEFSFGKNMFGQKAIMPGRLGSFTGQESVIGGFFLGFCLIFLSYIYKRNSNIKLNLLLAISLVLISFLIGERANFIKTFIAITIYTFFVYRVNLKIKFFSLILILCLIYPIFLTLNNDLYICVPKAGIQLLLGVFTKRGILLTSWSTSVGAMARPCNVLFVRVFRFSLTPKDTIPPLSSPFTTVPVGLGYFPWKKT